MAYIIELAKWSLGSLLFVFILTISEYLKLEKKVRELNNDKKDTSFT